MTARAEEGTFPLLPGRYHLAVNAPEGVSVRLDAGPAEGWGEMTLFRRHQDENGIYYSVLVCRKCGQPYIEGYEHAGKLHARQPAIEAGRAARRIFWLGTPLQNRVEDESDSDSEDENEDENLLPLRVDPATGQIVTSGGVLLTPVPCKKDDDEQMSYATQCPACGGHSGSTEAEIVTPMHPGNDALGAVVTQQVIEALPPHPENASSLPWGGRKLLTFSDNRQNAAYFAPWFERTSFDVALRAAIFHVLTKADAALDFDALTYRVLQHWKQGGEAILFDEEGRRITETAEIRSRLMGKIAAEFCTPAGRRISLEPLGAVRVTWDAKMLTPLRDWVKEHLPEAANDADAGALVHILLETVRREKALTNLGKVDMESAWIWGSRYKQKRSFGLHAGKWKHNWLPPEGTKRTNRRLQYLMRLLGETDEGRERARDFLAGFWNVLIEEGYLRALKPGHVIDARRLRFPRECAHACTACLCDYSNQRAWDQFDRKPVLQWLEQHLGIDVPNDMAALHAVPWPAPSLNALRDEVEGLHDLHLLAPGLESFAASRSGEDEQDPEESLPPALAWLIERLTSGVRIHLHTGQDLAAKPDQLGAPLRRALRFLKPWVESGKLRLGYLPQADKLHWETLPRICSGSPAGPAWFTRQPLTPLLRALLPQPVYRSADSTPAWGAIEPVLDSTQWYTRADLAGSLTVNVWKLKSGEARDFTSIFAPLKDACIESLVIHDAYCAAHPEALAQFLTLVKTMAHSLGEVIIECRELNYKSSNYLAPWKIEKILKERLTPCIGQEPKIAIAAWNHSHNDFHDRWLACSLVDENGLSVTRHFDLSGGIDHLMNPKQATTVYRYEPGAKQQSSATAG